MQIFGQNWPSAHSPFSFLEARSSTHLPFSDAKQKCLNEMGARYIEPRLKSIHSASHSHRELETEPMDNNKLAFSSQKTHFSGHFRLSLFQIIFAFCVCLCVCALQQDLQILFLSYLLNLIFVSFTVHFSLSLSQYFFLFMPWQFFPLSPMGQFFPFMWQLWSIGAYINDWMCAVKSLKSSIINGIPLWLIRSAHGRIQIISLCQFRFQLFVCYAFFLSLSPHCSIFIGHSSYARELFEFPKDADYAYRLGHSVDKFR